MPATLGFKSYPWVERVLKLRQDPWTAYGSAAGLLVVAAAAGAGIGELVGPQMPFTPFFPAVILSAVIGGLWPGILAAVVSTIVVWYLIVPPHIGSTLGAHELLQTSIFAAVSAANIAIVILLNALVDRLVVQQRNIQLLLDAAPSGFVLVDATGTIKLVNESMGKVFGYAPEELLGKKVELLVPDSQAAAHVRQRLIYMERPEVRQMGGRELRGRHKDGSPIPVEIGLNPVAQNGHGAFLATVLDISTRKQVEVAQRLLIDELEHRTRNLFAVIQGVIMTSAKGADNVPKLLHVLLDRIRVLSQAYALFRSGVESVSLFRILGAQAAAHPGRIAVEGEDLELAPRMAQTFALIVHELATNALKYGALSTSEGRVVVRGELEGKLYVFTWQESGGPTVVRPTHSGFGSFLLTKLPQDSAGDAEMEFAPQGLIYRLRIHRADVEPAVRSAAA